MKREVTTKCLDKGNHNPTNRLIHEAIISCTTSYRFDLAVHGALCQLGIVLVSSAFVKTIDFSSFDLFGLGKILRLWL